MSNTRKILLLLGDTVIFAMASYLMLLIRYGYPVSPILLDSHRSPLIVLYIIWVVIFYIFNLYDAKSARPTAQTTRNILLGLLTALLSGFLLFYLNPFPISPKTNLLILVGIFGILFFFWRILYFRIFKNNFKTPFVTIGKSEEIEILIKEIKSNPQLGYIFKGYCENIDEAVLKFEATGLIVYEKHLNNIDIEKLVQILYIREAFQNILYRIPSHLVDDSFIVSIMEKRENIFYKIIIRLVEIVVALFVLIITIPFSICVAIAIYLEDGKPIILKQTRVGIHNKIFSIYKFRSMIVLSSDGSAEKNGVEWTSVNDPRITKVGKIIRKLHIDEIPQMVNILKGDLALIGPRAEREEFVLKLSKEIPYYFVRHTIKPGFTGWAQIMFKYARTVDDSIKKFEYDLYYVKNQNLFLDIGIILKTIQIIFTH